MAEYLLLRAVGEAGQGAGGRHQPRASLGDSSCPSELREEGRGGRDALVVQVGELVLGDEGRHLEEGEGKGDGRGREQGVRRLEKKALGACRLPHCTFATQLHWIASQSATRQTDARRVQARS